MSEARVGIRSLLFGAAVSALLVVAATPAHAQSVGGTETGLAVVYADALHGHLTASGQTYDKTKLTAAHKTLPFGTVIKVTNQKNGKSVIVRINDRGPVQVARIVDLSSASAARLGFKRDGPQRVTIEIVEVGSGRRSRKPEP
jgi:rare lipoprotein A